jgi:hypothetical protein
MKHRGFSEPDSPSARQEGLGKASNGDIRKPVVVNRYRWPRRSLKGGVARSTDRCKLAATADAILVGVLTYAKTHCSCWQPATLHVG